MYATTSTGFRPDVRKSADYRVLKVMKSPQGTVAAVLKQVEKRTESTWTGLRYEDADALCQAYESSTLGQTRRDHLGAAQVTFTFATGSGWFVVEDCWGSKVTTSIARIGDTNLYSVSRVTTDLSLEASGGELTLL